MKYDKEYFLFKINELSELMELLVSTPDFDTKLYHELYIKYDLLFERMRILF